MKYVKLKKFISIVIIQLFVITDISVAVDLVYKADPQTMLSAYSVYTSSAESMANTDYTYTPELGLYYSPKFRPVVKIEKHGIINQLGGLKWEGYVSDSAKNLKQK